MKKLALATSAFALLFATATQAQPTAKDVATTYVDIGEAVFGDALTTAQALAAAVDTFLADPSPQTHDAAKAAWKAARPPYLQSEVFRFGNPIVDAWEGKINAWPLDEGLIDYTDPDHRGPVGENPYAALDIVANPHPVIAGTEIDATEITPDLIANTLNEAEGIETNVARGYHAIEFLLWGQDLHGTEAGAGERPWTDYAQADGCTHDNCDRRGAYLKAATDLLVSDLQYMADEWADGGAARANVLSDPQAGITAILTGMGSLSYGEMAGERMRLGLLLNDPEEEQDCFSDNTQWTHYYDGLGMQNVYLGHYTRVDGSLVEGPSLSEYVLATDPALDADMKGKLAATMTALTAITDATAQGMAYDMMLAPGNDEGDRLLTAAIDDLIDQTRSIERVVTALGAEGVTIEGSDTLQ